MRHVADGFVVAADMPFGPIARMLTAPLTRSAVGEIRSVHYPDFKASLPSMRGRTVAITGTTSGTGNVAARTVAELGAKLLMLNRPSDRARAAHEEIAAQHPDTDVVAVDCDLQSFASVRSAADEIRRICPQGVHVLCNNAGVMALPDQATQDGYDVQMQTNHLSHFLLTKELFPLIQMAAESCGDARIVNHSSVARMNPGKKLFAKYFDKRGGDLGGDGNMFQNLAFIGPRWVRYNQSKLANCAFTAALHNKLNAANSAVRALVAHPGFARTNLQKTTAKTGGMSSFIGNTTNIGYQSQEDGAMGILSCMCLPDAESGSFWGPGSGMLAMRGRAEPFALEPFYDNEATRELLWQKSEAAIGESFRI